MFCIIKYFIWPEYLYGYVGFGNLRISGGAGGSSGVLEFGLYNGTWGYVCTTGFNSIAARVACRQLGYAHGYYSTDYGYW